MCHIRYLPFSHLIVVERAFDAQFQWFQASNLFVPVLNFVHLGVWCSNPLFYKEGSIFQGIAF
jgi:hypothetical protein